MFCPKCGKENHDGTRFCKYCGESLETMMGKKSAGGMIPSAELRENDAGESGGKHGKKKIIIACAAVAVIVACVIGIVAYLGSQKDAEYNAKMKEANQYLQDLNYEKAETAYLDAIDIEPKRAEAYLELSDVYVVQEEYEEALEILEKGQKNTGDEERFEKQIKSVEKKAAEEPGDDTGSEQYRAYYDLVMEYQDKHGEAGYDIWNDVADDFVALTGLCVVKLFDFDRDGNEELVLGYCDETGAVGEEYRFEVWAWQDGALINPLPATDMDSGTAFNWWIATSVKNEIIYLESGAWSRDVSTLYDYQKKYLQYEDGAFLTKYDYATGEYRDPQRFSANGEQVGSYGELEQRLKDFPKGIDYQTSAGYIEEDNGVLRIDMTSNTSDLRSVLGETERNVELLKELAEKK